jgi:ABC-type Na+ efflux pump permease subunit
MKKMMLVALLGCAMLAGYGLSTVFAADAAPASVGVQITGDNYNLVQTLAKEEAGKANPTYAKINALKIKEAKVDGKVVPELAGKTVHYIPTKAAEPLMAGAANAGKSVTVIGKLFQNENALLVQSIEGGADEGGLDGVKMKSKSGLPVL